MAAGGYATSKPWAADSASRMAWRWTERKRLRRPIPRNNAVKKLDFADPPSLSFATTVVGSTSSDSPQTVAGLERRQRGAEVSDSLRQ